MPTERCRVHHFRVYRELGTNRVFSSYGLSNEFTRTKAATSLE